MIGRPPGSKNKKKKKAKKTTKTAKKPKTKKVEEMFENFESPAPRPVIINDKFDRGQNGKPILIKTDAVYGKNDAFYDAKGSYSFLDTCNTWSNNGLKAAGQKAALWTPSDFGIFQHYQ